jgi:hypothetical protein
MQTKAMQGVVAEKGSADDKRKSPKKFKRHQRLVKNSSSVEDGEKSKNKKRSVVELMEVDEEEQRGLKKVRGDDRLGVVSETTVNTGLSEQPARTNEDCGVELPGFGQPSSSSGASGAPEVQRGGHPFLIRNKNG